MVFSDRAAKSLDDALPDLAYQVIDRAVKDAALGDPTAGAWLLSDTANEWADMAGFDDGILGQVALKVLEGYVDGT